MTTPICIIGGVQSTALHGVKMVILVSSFCSLLAQLVEQLTVNQ